MKNSLFGQSARPGSERLLIVESIQGEFYGLYEQELRLAPRSMPHSHHRGRDAQRVPGSLQWHYGSGGPGGFNWHDRLPGPTRERGGT